jgi:hypothetical protein
MVTAKGGDGYWNPHPSDDPIAIVDELIPSRQASDSASLRTR